WRSGRKGAPLVPFVLLVLFVGESSGTRSAAGQRIDQEGHKEHEGCPLPFVLFVLFVVESCGLGVGRSWRSAPTRAFPQPRRKERDRYGSNRTSTPAISKSSPWSPLTQGALMSRRKMS